MKHFECVDAIGSFVARCFEFVEEMFAGQLVTEQQQLQRPALPGVANIHLRRQHRFIDRRAEGVFGVEDVGRRKIVLPGGTLKLLEKFLDVSAEFVGVLGDAPMVQQDEHVEAVVEQIDKTFCRAVGCRLLGTQAGGNGKQAGGCGHGVTAISSMARSR
ncbi:hypothetical protein SDC9_198483 [bioreactor metagenome]|uniref:Uncharacterized protein n=1 Tax=bioreactor metagenome TaxID=1076179 RepID=A0A645IR42_9ZZZZ